MIQSISAIFKKYPGYRGLVAGGLISSAGTGLTQVAVYGELARMNAGPATFAVAFAVSVLPGLFSSQVAERFLRRIPPVKMLVLAEILGAMLLVLPALGMMLKSQELLLAAQFSSSLIAGIAMPAGMGINSILFKEKEELASASALGTIAFSSQVLIGYGIGSLVYGKIPSHIYLLLDFASYLAGAWLISRSQKSDTRLGELLPIESASVSTPLNPLRARLGTLTPDQKRAFLLMPLLTCVGAPTVALLPSIGMDFGSSAVPLFLFAKTVGQLLGPMLMPPSRYETESKNSRQLILFLASFAALYLLVASTKPMLPIALGLILMAHILSNRVYSLALFALPRYFPSDRIVRVAATQYQVQTSLMVILGASAGKAASILPIPHVIGGFSALAVGASLYLLGSLREHN